MHAAPRRHRQIPKSRRPAVPPPSPAQLSDAAAFLPPPTFIRLAFHPILLRTLHSNTVSVAMWSFQTINVVSKRRRDDDSDSDDEPYLKVRVSPVLFVHQDQTNQPTVAENANLEQQPTSVPWPVTVPAARHAASSRLALSTTGRARTRGHDARPFRRRRGQLAR